MASERHIYHLIQRSDWEAAQASGEYRAASLETEGFIHCSSRHQVLDVANLLYRAEPDLLLLVVDVGRVGPEVRYEGDEDLFPHIYGPLPVDAVSQVIEFPPNPDGSFDLPEGI